MASGAQYAAESVEFRLAALHYFHKNEYRRRMDSLLGNLATSIFFAAGIRRITDESREKISSQAREELGRLFELAAMTGNSAMSKEERRELEKKRATAQKDYASILASTGEFNSLDQIQAAVAALNETIKETRNADPGPGQLSD